MIVYCLAILGFVLAMIPLIIFARNLPAFGRLPSLDQDRLVSGSPATGKHPSISVLIPARNEAESIGDAIASVLANADIDLELIVLDDSSEDHTPQIVEEITRGDARVRLEHAAALPSGWCGKQFACHQLSQIAKHELLMWIDADVRIAPDALARIAMEMTRSRVSLLSGFPRELTGSFLEKLLIPLIHFILLGYCPVWLMRRIRFVGLGAGCGQLFVARRQDYLKAGGHAAIRASLHDGIALPRAMRRAGFLTGIFDATDLANCRMYHSAAETWQGLLKNASEGLATPRAILPWTVILLGGQVLPFALLSSLFIRRLFFRLDPAVADALWLSAAACGACYAIRLVSALRFRQSVLVVLLHPVAVVALLLIQWQAAVLRAGNRPTAWRGRAYPVPRVSNP